ncbi:MAG: hypothetical protein ACOYEW_05855 [Anaerolineae bacterium]|jgi:hypothetical protein
MTTEPGFGLSEEQEATVRRILALAGMPVGARLTYEDLERFLALLEFEILAEDGMDADGLELWW